MTDLNNVTLIGRLTKDIDVRYTNAGKAVGNFSLAVNRSTKVGEEWKDEANFFEIVCFGKTAENLKQYLVKGSQVAINGYLKQDRWEKDGQKFSKIGIVADNIQLVGGKKESGNNVPQGNYNGGQQQFQGQFYSQNQNYGYNIFQEDIPFVEF